MRLFVADLASAAPLRLDPSQAADIVWATNAAEMYQLLVPATLRALPRRHLAPHAPGRLEPAFPRRPASCPGRTAARAGSRRGRTTILPPPQRMNAIQLRPSKTAGQRAAPGPRANHGR